MQIKGTLMLLGAAFFWGTTFVAQMAGVNLHAQMTGNKIIAD